MTSHKWTRISPVILVFVLSHSVQTCLCAETRVSEKHENSNLTRATNSIQANDLKSHVAFLASDALEGREAGSQGSRAASAFITERLQKFGVQPAGPNDSYEQRFGKNYRNLIGILPGSDPELAQEVIAIGAHYDHVGYGKSGNSRGTVGQIHNGADDNGSGVSAILEIIQAMSLLEVSPRRSILFFFWDAEELGLLGSKHWTSHPTIEFDRVKFYINLDMVGRLTENELDVYGSRTAAGLRALYSQTNDDQIRAIFHWDLIADSDHHPFFKLGVPILMPWTRKHVDYHRASDDFDKVNYAGQEKIARHWFRILLELANTDAVPQFRQKSHNENEKIRQRVEATPARQASRLGISWNTEQSESAGELIIANLVSTSPGWKAGLRPGDHVLAINGRPFKNSNGFIQNVHASNPDSVLSIRRAQADEEEEIPLRLNGSPVLLGLTFRPDDAEPNSLIVSSVAPETPAEAAGLQRNDRILGVDGYVLSSTDEASQKILNSQRSMKIRYARLGVTAEMKLQPLKRLDPPHPNNRLESP